MPDTAVFRAQRDLWWREKNKEDCSPGELGQMTIKQTRTMEWDWVL